MEWQPFTRIVTDDTITRRLRFLVTFDIESTDHGARVTKTHGPLRGPMVDKILFTVYIFLFGKNAVRKGMGKLRQLMEDDIAAGRVSDHVGKNIDDEVVASAALEALQSTTTD